MNYIKEAKEILKHYRDLKIATDNLRDRLGQINTELDGSKAITYSDMPHGSVVDTDKVCNLIYERDRYNELLLSNMFKLNRLEKVLDKLEGDYKLVLIQSYVEQKTDTDISKELKCTREKVNRIKGQAIRQLAIQLFGIEVV